MVMTEEEMNLRFSNRRFLAKLSFYFASAVGISLILSALLSDDLAKRIGEIQWLVGTVIGMFTTVLTWYYTATSYEQARMK